MSEKQFDSFDERFREAASQYEPPFEESSWAKLAPHLPAKETQRRPVAWWLPDALMVGLLLFIALNLPPFAGSDEKPSEAVSNSRKIPASTQAPVEKVITPANAVDNATAKANTQTAGDVANASASAHKPPTPGSNYSYQQTGSPVLPLNGGQRSVAYTSSADKIPDVVYSNPNVGKMVDGITSPEKLPEQQQYASPGTQEENPASRQKDNNEELQQKLQILEGQAIETGLMAKDNIGKKKGAGFNRSRGFYVFGNAGSEWSFVSGNEVGKSTFAWGVGLGYRFSPKWAVQAGYFSTNKLYDAGPGDYNPKPGTYYYNLTIREVSANCRITEVPIMLSYTAINRGRQSLLVSAGLSSLIMNSENYHYNYLRANGTPAYSRYTYKTHGSHLFAGVLLGAGYNFSINKHISLSAEPYLKIPLYGVGEGSVMITSFGIMAGARYALPDFKRK